MSGIERFSFVTFRRSSAVVMHGMYIFTVFVSIDFYFNMSLIGAILTIVLQIAQRTTFMFSLSNVTE